MQEYFNIRENFEFVSVSKGEIRIRFEFGFQEVLFEFGFEFKNLRRIQIQTR